MFSLFPDDRKEHAVEVEVPEVPRDLDPVEEEGHDGDGEVEGDADVVALLDEGLAVRGQHHRGSTARPEVGAVEAEGKEVVAHAVASPLLAASGVRDVSLRNFGFLKKC